MCGFFNVPQLFATRVMRRDLRLTVLIRKDLKVKPFADDITKAALSTQLFLRPRVLVWPESNSRTRARQLDAQPTEASVHGE